MARRLLDMTRTLARAGREAPGAVDRVERAWIRRLAARDAAWGPPAAFLLSSGPRHVVLDAAGATALLDALEGTVDLPPADLRGAFSPWRTDRQRRADSLARRLAVAQGEDLAAVLAAAGPPFAYLNVAQAHLDAERLRGLRAGGCVATAAMIHDLIPITHPELARTDAANRLYSVLAAAALADGVVFASEEARHAARAVVEAWPAEITAPPGLGPLPAPPHGAAGAPDGDPSPYFVMLGPVEPRRNHLALLWAWRRLWEELGPAAPRLWIVGRRGEEAEPAAPLLDRAAMSGRIVHARAGLDDAAVAALLAGARALLAPAFAEASGLAVGEALALGCPVIASDLPAHRAAGGEAADYLDPLDLPEWIERILAYAGPPDDGPDPRAAQVRRMAAWRPRPWAPHFAAVDALLERLGG